MQEPGYDNLGLKYFTI